MIENSDEKIFEFINIKLNGWSILKNGTDSSKNKNESNIKLKKLFRYGISPLFSIKNVDVPENSRPVVAEVCRIKFILKI